MKDQRGITAPESPAHGIPDSFFAWAKGQYGGSLEQVFVVDREYRVVFVNAALERLVSARRDEVLGGDVREFLPLYRRRAWLDALDKALDGEYTTSPHCFIDPTLAERNVSVTYAPVVGGAGRVEGALAVRAEKGLYEATLGRIDETESRFRTMANVSPVLLWMSEPDSLCSFFNQTWLEFTGRTMDEERGVKWAEGVYPEDFQDCMDTYMQAFNSRVPFRMTYRLRRFDGEYRWILDTGVPRYSPRGEFLGFIGSCVDITERVRAEEALKEMVANLNRTNAELERFAYVASHDLQEPMLKVMTFCDLLATEHGRELTHDARDCVNRMRTAARRMRTLIHDLLEYSRLRTMKDVFRKVRLNEVVTEVLGEMEPVLRNSDATVKLRKLPTINGDPVQLRQLFRQIIDNAVKFRRADVPPGVLIEKDMGKAPPKTSTPLVGIRVEDNGCGIEERFIPDIFEPFRKHQGHEYPEGTGIGLAICRRIIENHGGVITVDSEVGKGTTFTLWFAAN